MGTELYRFEVSIGRNANFFQTGVKWGKKSSDFYSKQTRPYFSGPNHRAKFHQNDRLTE